MGLGGVGPELGWSRPGNWDLVMNTRLYWNMAGAGGEKRTGDGRQRRGDRGRRMKKPDGRGLSAQSKQPVFIRPAQPLDRRLPLQGRRF